MIATATLLTFMAAAIVVLVLPGPGVLYVVARSLGQGRHAGLVSALGLAVGVFAHVLAAAVGLSALLLTSATAFEMVKLIGAGYLIYLGLKTLFGTRAAVGPHAAPTAPLGRLFWDGVVVSVFNPKIALFFMAFLPQFVDPAAGPIAGQIIMLGCIYALLAFVTDGTYAVLADRVRDWVAGPVLRGPWPRYLTGGVYIGLGVHTALTGRRA